MTSGTGGVSTFFFKLKTAFTESGIYPLLRGLENASAISSMEKL